MQLFEESTQTVTAVSGQKRNKKRINIYLDGEYAFSLSRTTAAKIQIGQNLSQATIEDLLSEDSVESAKQRVFRFVSYRPRSIWEVERYLARKDYDGTTVERVIGHLVELKILDDQEFTRYWVEQRETF